MMPRTRAAAVGHIVVGIICAVAGTLVALLGDFSGTSRAGIPTMVLVVLVFASAVMLVALGSVALRRMRE